MLKKIIGVILIMVSCMACLFGGCKKDKANEIVAAPKTLKVLAIGNSFSVDMVHFLYNVASGMGVEKIIIGNAAIGGCDLDTHAQNMQNGAAKYEYYKNTTGSWSVSQNNLVESCIKDEDWDFITIQQASHYSGQPSSYNNLQKIVNFIKANMTNKDAKIFWQATWAYQQNSNNSHFFLYNKDQTTMYNAIINTYKTMVKTNSDIYGVIPNTTAIQNARTSFIGDNLTVDGYHLNGIGRWIAAMTCYQALTGHSVETLKHKPSMAMTRAQFDVAKESVINAISKPLAVTTSKYLQEG